MVGFLLNKNMGYIIKSECRVCNYENTFSFGGGRFNYQTYCPVPAINQKTGEFENINFYEHENSSEYLFYHDKKLKSQNLSEDNYCFSNFDLEINSQDNYCSKCKNQTLDFQFIGMID